jgi:hypothetical protein
MRNPYEEIWRFETKNFAVVYSVAPDEDLDLSWDDNGTTRDGLERGIYVAFVAKLEVLFKPTGESLGVDYLGDCIYESATAFMNHRGSHSSYFTDMISVAIREARKNFQQHKNAILDVHLKAA